MKASPAEITDILRCHGVNPSSQRIAILGYLMQTREHPTADCIYRDLLADKPTLSRTTVYSTLNLLVDCGVVSAVDVDGESRRYDYPLTPHAHFHCTGCQKVFDVDMPVGVESVMLPQGFTAKSTSVYYHGLCRDCMEN